MEQAPPPAYAKTQAITPEGVEIVAASIAEDVPATSALAVSSSCMSEAQVAHTDAISSTPISAESAPNELAPSESAKDAMVAQKRPDITATGDAAQAAEPLINKPPNVKPEMIKGHGIPALSPVM